MPTCFKFLLLAAIVQLSAVSFVLGQNNTYPYPQTGRVGIGTTSPLATFHVEAPRGSTTLAKFTITSMSAADAFLNIGNSTADSTVFMPLIYGRSNSSRPIGLYLTGETGDNVPTGIDTPLAAVTVDGRNKTGARLLNNNVFAVNSYGINLLMVKANGSVGIGVTDTKGYLLAVGGSMIAEKIKVKVKTAWPDFVFAPGYELPSLGYIEKYIAEHQHLPEMPSAKEVTTEGLDLGEMNRKLLQKVEELTLYLIDQQKELTQLKASNVQFQEEMNELKAKIK